MKKGESFRYDLSRADCAAQIASRSTIPTPTATPARSRLDSLAVALSHPASCAGRTAQSGTAQGTGDESSAGADPDRGNLAPTGPAGRPREHSEHTGACSASALAEPTSKVRTGRCPLRAPLQPPLGMAAAAGDLARAECNSGWQSHPAADAANQIPHRFPTAKPGQGPSQPHAAARPLFQLCRLRMHGGEAPPARSEPRE